MYYGRTSRLILTYMKLELLKIRYMIILHFAILKLHNDEHYSYTGFILRGCVQPFRETT